MAKKPSKTLPEFIDEMGDEEFSRRFDVSLRATRAYRLRERKPRATGRLVTRILTETPVTWEGIYSS